MELLGYEINQTSSGWLVHTDTIPVNKRFYSGKDAKWKNVSCFDGKRFINTELFSPVLYDKDNPMPKYNPAWEVYDSAGKNKKIIDIRFPQRYISWWTEQWRRCINGYEVGGVKITGIHYFYLNFWKIKSKKKTEGYISPRFLDLDFIFFSDIQEAYRQHKHYLCLKRRQIGMSEKAVAVIAYNYTFFAGSESLIIAGESQFADQSFEKLKIGLDQMSRFSESDSADAFYRRRIANNDSQIKAGFVFKGVERGFASVAYKRIAKHNSQIASGLSTLSTVLYEESGRFPDLDIVDSMINPILEEGGVIGDGKIKLYIGTGGEMDKGAAKFESYYYNPEEHNILEFENEFDDNPEIYSGLSKVARFFPAWYYYAMDHDGNSYKELGIALLNERRSKIKDPIKLHTEKTQMPIYPHEAFLRSGESPFNTEKLNRQKGFLFKSKIKDTYKYGRIDPIVEGGKVIGMQWTTGDPTEFDADGDYKYPILLHNFPMKPLGSEDGSDETRVIFNKPRYANLYFGGTDSYDRDDAPSSDSLGSCSIFMGDPEDRLLSVEGRRYVARLTWRPTKAEKFFEMSARLCAFFSAENLIEYSTLTIFEYYQNNGYSHLLKERPSYTYATIKDSVMNNRYGVDPATKYVWENAYREYIESYFDRMYDLVQVDRAMAYRKNVAGKRHNCDITVGAMLAYQNFKDSEGKKIKPTEVNKKKKGDMLKGLPYRKVWTKRRA